MPLVVLDATLLATATAFAGSSYRAWPDVPPVTSNPEADCVAVIAGAHRHGHDLGLVVSLQLLQQVSETLRVAIGLRDRDIDAYLTALVHFARRSGGRIVDDPPASHTLPAHLGVPLALGRTQRAVVVGAHPELRDLGPEWSTDRIPVLGAREFSIRADAARRARRSSG